MRCQVVNTLVCIPEIKIEDGLETSQRKMNKKKLVYIVWGSIKVQY